ncbi:MAG: SRPBCC family protein [Chloroflexota bacterium]
MCAHHDQSHNRWTTAPLRLSFRAFFETDVRDIFRALSNPLHMCRLFPWMHRIDLETEPAVDQSDPERPLIRRCHFGNGMVLEEEILDWIPPEFYAYRGVEESHPFGMVGHVGTIACLSVDNGTHLSWQQYFDHRNPTAMGSQIGSNMEMALERLSEAFGGKIIKKEIVNG